MRNNPYGIVLFLTAVFLFAALSPLLYVQLIWATVLGWIVFGQFPDLLAIAGMLIIGASGLRLVLYRPRMAASALAK